MHDTFGLILNRSKERSMAFNKSGNAASFDAVYHALNAHVLTGI